MTDNIFYTDGTAWVSNSASTTINTAFDSYLSMSDDGYADLARKLEKFLAPSEVIVKCSYCGQWAAVKTSCRHCGAAVG